MSLREPLRFEPNALPKVWGGHGLAAFLDTDLGSEEPIGEVWQLADRDECTSVVAEGSFAGRSLRGLMLSECEALLGRSRPSPSGGFPLLVKLLEAAKPLSVQVHPDARAVERLSVAAEPKHECWYVVAAEPGSEILLGLKPDVDAASFAAQASEPTVVDLIQAFPVERGQFIDVPAGTVHSIGAGITLIEVQQNSDTSFRIWDWNRTGSEGEGRETRVEEALRSIDYERPVAPPRVPELDDGAGVNRSAHLLDCDFFSVELLEIHEPLNYDAEGLACVYVVVDGRARLKVPGEEAEWSISRGQVWLIPASVGAHSIDSADGELELLRVEAKA